MTKFVGGSDITKLTFPSYEALFANEDNSVREASLEYLSKIITEFGAKDGVPVTNLFWVLMCYYHCK